MQDEGSCATSSRIERTAKYASETQHSILAATMILNLDQPAPQAVNPQAFGPPTATLTAFPLTF